MKLLLLLTAIFFALNATKLPDDETLKKEIGRMLVVGFNGQSINKKSQILKDIKKYNLGGVILFDKFYKNRTRTKNISSSTQLQNLSTQLQKISQKPLIISIDQEGGKVARLKPYYGFSKIPSAFEVAQGTQKSASRVYEKQSKMLQVAGINTNFAPVVDLAINPKNRVIVGLERSFSKESKKVVAFAKIVIEEQSKAGIISVLKHFPGHGSSLEDSHKGFVDISKTWSKKELEPYIQLIDANMVDMIMSAHVFNSKLDKKYPATLSYNINTKLLRNELGFKGVIISDDMQMRAISEQYSLKESLTLAINAGVNILLFGNQLAQNSVKELVNIIFSGVKNGTIKYENIKSSNTKIENLHTKNSIIQKPIIFKDERIKLTKEYIKTHYGLNVKSIEIEPKSIVLHWTAIMAFEKCFKRLNAQKLYTDRADIANASLLNVSSHFLVDRDGTIYQLMPENIMARHVIGLNYSAIGIENVGGENNEIEDLTKAQLEANIKLVKYLKQKYPKIEYLLGHHEYQNMQKSSLWLEKDANYRTQKADPGEKFMSRVRVAVEKLHLKRP